MSRLWIRRAARAAACALAFSTGGLLSELESSAHALSERAPQALAPVEYTAPAPAVPVPVPLESSDEPLDWSRGAVITGATPHRLIHFTFDDGPDRRTTPGLLALLDELDIRATFFVTTQRMASMGGRARTERAILADIADRGHGIGNHTVNHIQLPLLSPIKAHAEVEEASRLIEEITGSRPLLMRPPGGSRSPRIDGALADLGYTQVLWNVGSGDFQVRTADDVVETFKRVLARREREYGERGGIVLMHDTHPWSVAALPRIVAFLRNENCRLLAQGEELYDIVDTPDFFFEPRAEDPSQVAGPARPDRSVMARRQVQLADETQRRCDAQASAADSDLSHLL